MLAVAWRKITKASMAKPSIGPSDFVKRGKLIIQL